MTNLIVANWKCNPKSKKEAENIFNKVKKGIKKAKAEVIVCPPSVYLPLLKGIALGAQNFFYKEEGAFTGEISCEMLKNLGVEYVIAGHSERRKYFGESNEMINKKIKEAAGEGMKVIFCIGESAEERDAGKKNEVLEKQIKQGLSGIENLENIIIAYEPVWAIGTGNNCSVEETKESIDFIRKFVKPETKIIYGGSVKSENSAGYIKDAGANGLLVGGDSLDAEEFIKIVKSAE